MSRVPFPGSTPRVFGHRGAAGLAPENTLPSFALALALGANVLELDVHASADGQIVVMHDPTLERTTNGSGPLREQPWSTLQRLDAGFHFTRDGRDFPYRGQGVRLPTLEALLLAFPHAACNIEIKQADPPIAADVIGLIRRQHAEHRVLLAAEHDAIMTEIRRHAGGIATSCTASEVAAFVSCLTTTGFDAYTAPGCALQIPPRFGPIELVSADSVTAAHRHGMEVHVWTINQRDEMERLLDCGVDGIMSDLPGMARVTVDKRAKP